MSERVGITATADGADASSGDVGPDVGSPPQKRGFEPRSSSRGDISEWRDEASPERWEAVEWRWRRAGWSVCITITGPACANVPSMPPTVGSNSIDGSAGSQPQTARRRQRIPDVKIHITIWRSDDARRITWAKSSPSSSRRRLTVERRRANAWLKRSFEWKYEIGSSETATTIA